MVERQPSKLHVASSNLVSRSTDHLSADTLEGERLSLVVAACIGIGLGLLLLTQGQHLLVLGLAVAGLVALGLVALVRRRA